MKRAYPILGFIQWILRCHASFLEDRITLALTPHLFLWAMGSTTKYGSFTTRENHQRKSENPPCFAHVAKSRVICIWMGLQKGVYPPNGRFNKTNDVQPSNCWVFPQMFRYQTHFVGFSIFRCQNLHVHDLFGILTAGYHPCLASAVAWRRLQRLRPALLPVPLHRHCPASRMRVDVFRVVRLENRRSWGIELRKHGIYTDSGCWFQTFFYCSQYMGCHPSHWLSYFSRWLFFTTNQDLQYVI